LLKQRVSMIEGSCKSLSSLRTAAQKVWGGVSEEDIKPCIGDMSEQVQAVERAKGWHTMY